MVDTHAHLTMPELMADLPAVLDRARVAGVAAIITVGIDLNSSEEAVRLAQAHTGVFAAVGIHPNDAGELPADWQDRLTALASRPGVVALGETGLDYYRDRVGRDRQRELFRFQLDLARRLGLPVIVHNREASAEVGSILTEWSAELDPGHPRGVLHCFSGDQSLMDSCCAAGFFVSFAGPITYRNAKYAPDLVRAAPVDRLLVETDSPYLAPHPHRGKANEPALVWLVAQRVAELRGETLEQVVSTTGRNAAALFGLEPASATDR